MDTSQTRQEAFFWSVLESSTSSLDATAVASNLPSHLLHSEELTLKRETRGMASDEQGPEQAIYFERQTRFLCGLHVLNNLVRCPSFLFHLLNRRV